MNHVKMLFLSLLKNDISVQKMIYTLSEKNVSDYLKQEDITAYQAYCCAALAKESKRTLQKIQYIKEYNTLIQQSLYIDKECLTARIIRFLVEKNLTNVKFTSHQDEDRQFLYEHSSDDEDYKELIEKMLK